MFAKIARCGVQSFGMVIHKMQVQSKDEVIIS
jgi:hypothetical protein